MSISAPPPFTDPSRSGSCFFNSTSPDCSKREVVTLIVLGVLGMMLAGVALYGYLVNPSWLVGAHVLALGAFVCSALAGVLVVIKTCSKSNSG